MCWLLPKDALDELYDQIKAHFSKVSPDGFTYQDPFDSSVTVKEFPIQVGGQTIFLEPMLHAYNDVLLVEVWTRVLSLLEEDDLENLPERLEEPAFVEQLVRKTAKGHSYGPRPAEEIAMLYKLWKDGGGSFALGGYFELPEPLKSQALEYLTQRITGWKIVMVEDFEGE